MTADPATLMPVIRLALRQAVTLPATDQVDVYRGVAAIAGGFDTELANHALSLAQAIEDARGLQLYFQNLFTED